MAASPWLLWQVANSADAALLQPDLCSQRSSQPVSTSSSKQGGLRIRIKNFAAAAGEPGALCRYSPQARLRVYGSICMRRSLFPHPPETIFYSRTLEKHLFSAGFELKSTVSGLGSVWQWSRACAPLQCRQRPRKRSLRRRPTTLHSRSSRRR